MSTLALVRHRSVFLLAALFWTVLPTPSYERPLPLFLDGRITHEDDSGVSEIAWDSSPDIPTARFEASTSTTHALVEVRPPSPVVGETVQVRLTTSDRRGHVVSGVVHFGTPRGAIMKTIVDCFSSDDRWRRPQEAAPTQKSNVREYVFHSPGWHRMEAVLEVVDCDSRGQLTVSGAVDVRAGRSRPNQQPIAGADIEILQQPSGAYHAQHLVTVRVTDPDGFLHHAHVDFGDGSEPETFTEQHRWTCRDDATRSVGFFESSTGGHHSFPGRSRFTIRATVTTTSCDGRNPQTTTVTRSVTTH